MSHSFSSPTTPHYYSIPPNEGPQFKRYDICEDSTVSRGKKGSKVPYLMLNLHVCVVVLFLLHVLVGTLIPFAYAQHSKVVPFHLEVRRQVKEDHRCTGMNTTTIMFISTTIETFELAMFQRHSLHKITSVGYTTTTTNKNVYTADINAKDRGDKVVSDAHCLTSKLITICLDAECVQACKSKGIAHCTEYYPVDVHSQHLSAAHESTGHEIEIETTRPMYVSSSSFSSTQSPHINVSNQNSNAMSRINITHDDSDIKQVLEKEEMSERSKKRRLTKISLLKWEFIGAAFKMGAQTVMYVDCDVLILKNPFFEIANIFALAGEQGQGLELQQVLHLSEYSRAYHNTTTTTTNKVPPKVIMSNRSATEMLGVNRESVKENEGNGKKEVHTGMLIVTLATRNFKQKVLQLVNHMLENTVQASIIEGDVTEQSVLTETMRVLEVAHYGLPTEKFVATSDCSTTNNTTATTSSINSSTDVHVREDAVLYHMHCSKSSTDKLALMKKIHGI